MGPANTAATTAHLNKGRWLDGPGYQQVGASYNPIPAMYRGAASIGSTINELSSLARARMSGDIQGDSLGDMVEMGLPSGAMVDRSLFGHMPGPGVEPMTTEERHAGFDRLGSDLLPGGSAVGGLLGTMATRNAADTLPDMVASRFPTAQGVIDVTPVPPHDWLSSRGAMALDPKRYAANVQTAYEYPYMRKTGLRNVESKADAIVDHERSNLNFLWDKAGDNRIVTKQWYDGANKLARDAGAESGFSVPQASGVIAVLSPTKEWNANVTIAERMMHTMATQGNTRWTEEMTPILRRMMASSKEAKKWGKDVYGKTLNEVTDPEAAALWIRAFDEAYNPQNVDKFLPTGERAGKLLNNDGSEAPLVWQSLNAMGKAVKIMRDGRLANISANLGAAHKVRNFYNNIVRPESNRGDVTMDTHAIAGAALNPYGSSAMPVAHNFGGKNVGEPGIASSTTTGSGGTYGLHAEAYERAAADQGVKPREMQSVVWEAAKDLFDVKGKGPTSNARRIWDDYRRGRITQPQAQELMFEAHNGFNPAR